MNKNNSSAMSADYNSRVVASSSELTKNNNNPDLFFRCYGETDDKKGTAHLRSDSTLRVPDAACPYR